MNITRHWISIIAFMLALLPAAQASASPAIPETPSKKAGSPSALMDLIEQGNYQKALNLFQQLKQGQKNDPGLEILHIQALMGLHQNMAAARIAMREAPANPNPRRLSRTTALNCIALLPNFQAISGGF
ncbi:MAG: hypothetical protein P8018_02255 [Acidobacteriota bacterium]